MTEEDTGGQRKLRPFTATQRAITSSDLDCLNLETLTCHGLPGQHGTVQPQEPEATNGMKPEKWQKFKLKQVYEEGLEIWNIFRIYKAQLPFQKMIFQPRADY